jgi:monoamine oxidase
MDKMASTVPLEAPWEAPNAAEWDAMTVEDFVNQADLDPAVKMIQNIAFEIACCAPP